MRHLIRPAHRLRAALKSERRSELGSLPLKHSLRTVLAPSSKQRQRITTPTAFVDSVPLRARVQAIRVSKRTAFLTLQQGFSRVQCVVPIASEGGTTSELTKALLDSVTVGSVVDVTGKRVETTQHIRSASSEWQTVELLAEGLSLVSLAARLPLTHADSNASVEADRALREAASQSFRQAAEGSKAETDDSSASTSPAAARDAVVARLDTRLDARVVDVRAPLSSACIEMCSVAGGAFEEFCRTAGLSRIFTPRLLSGASEGGSDVFQLNYFGRTSTLAQSPQLSKQMALMADVGRGVGVYEVGAVYRAEKSFTHRHLCEFSSLDVELQLQSDGVGEVVTFAERVFAACFARMREAGGQIGIEAPPLRTFVSEGVARELGEGGGEDVAVGPVVGSDGGRCLRISFTHAAQLISEAVEGMSQSAASALGVTVQSATADLTTPNERLLGTIVAAKYGVDFYSVVGFPTRARAFYSRPLGGDIDAPHCASFDCFVRGEEACSGAQRIHDPVLLERVLEQRGMDAQPLASYIDAFRYGAWPHGGFAIGLERLVALYLGLNNVRNVVLFPRDPKRLSP